MPALRILHQLCYIYSILLQVCCHSCGVIAQLTVFALSKINRLYQATNQHPNIDSQAALSPVHDIQVQVSFMLDDQLTIRMPYSLYVSDLTVVHGLHDS